MAAVQNLNQTTGELSVTQQRISTGRIINQAKDNAAVYAIAQTLRADKASLVAISNSINRAKSILDISLAAAESIQSILMQMKQKVVAASDQGLDADSRKALQHDFNALRDQIVNMAKNANFNGTNMINGPGVAGSATAPLKLIAIVSPDGINRIEISRINLQLAAAGTTTFANPVQDPVTKDFSGDFVQLAEDSTFTDAASAQSMITLVDQSIKNLSLGMTVMGAGSTSLDTQATYLTLLSDTITAGIGNLVDADMARESARLQALQVKQQLGTQALSIANKAPQTILSLFGN